MKRNCIVTSLLVLLSSGLATSAVAQEVTAEMRKSCLPATDYEGCIRSFVSPPTPREELDYLGMPKIKGWLLVENRPENAIRYVNVDGAVKVKVRGENKRYIAYEYVDRWLQSARAGTSGYTTTIGAAMTSCYGSFGSVNCTTTPAPTISIPGRSAVAGGIQQEQTTVLIDCLERKAQWDGKGSWESIEDRETSRPIADKWCGKIESLPESAKSIEPEGTANEKDLLAAKVLPGSDPEVIKKTYGNLK